MREYQHGTSSGYGYHKCRCDQCKAWKAREGRRDYERHKEQRLAKARDYRAVNKDQINERARQYYQDNPEKMAARRQGYLDWQKRNSERVNAKNRRWRQQNRWATWFSNWHYRERKRGQEYDAETLAWIKSLADATCTYCDQPAETIDHIIPRSKGGTNARENLTPACHRCNRRKNSMSVEDFLRRLREEGT